MFGASSELASVMEFGFYGCRACSVAVPRVWDPAISTDCFRRVLKTYLFARYYCIQRMRGSLTIMRYINLLITYLLTYVLTY